MRDVFLLLIAVILATCLFEIKVAVDRVGKILAHETITLELK